MKTLAFSFAVLSIAFGVIATLFSLLDFFIDYAFAVTTLTAPVGLLCALLSRLCISGADAKDKVGNEAVRLMNRIGLWLNLFAFALVILSVNVRGLLKFGFSQ